MMSTKLTGKKQERFRISGKAFWVHILEKNKLSHKYQLDLSIDVNTAKALKIKGIEVKSNDKDADGRPENNRGQYVTLKSEYPPKIYDAKKNEITGKLLVGNGSEINVATHIYNWKFGRDQGISLGLDAIQIVNLVSYKDSMGDLFEEEDGFESSLDDSTLNTVNKIDELDNFTPPSVDKENPF